MPFWCIDPTNGNDGTGAVQATQAAAEATPYKTHAAVITAIPSAGDAVLFIGGDLALGVQTMSIADLTYGSYGTGRGGADANGARNAITVATATADGLTIDGLEFTGGTNDGNNAITVIISGDDTTDKSTTFSNCLIHDDGAGDDAPDGDGHGMDISGGGTTVEDSEIYNYQDDGIFNEGTGCIFRYNFIHDVDQTAARKSGDCLKYSGTASNCLATHNIFDHSATNRKQAIIMDGTGTNNIAEHNKCVGGEWVINSKNAGNIIRRNLAESFSPGGTLGESPTSTRGISVEIGASQTIESNIIHSKEEDGTNFLIRSSSAATVIQGNVIYGRHADGLTNDASILLGLGAGNDTIIRNNIIGGGTGGRHIITANTVDLTPSNVDYNIYTEDGTFWINGNYYANFAAWQAAGYDVNGKIVAADTLFRDAANGDFRLNAGQEVLGAQVSYADFLGRRNYPTIIGAYIQPLTNASGTLANTAGNVDTTNGTVLAANGVLTDTKYPNWGIRT